MTYSKLIAAILAFLMTAGSAEAAVNNKAVTLGDNTQAPVAQQAKQNEQKDQEGNLVISEAGTYVLTGSMKGSVMVDPGQGDVELVLDGVDIDAQGNPAIQVLSGDSLKISVPEGSVNRIVGNGEVHAAIYSAVDTVFDGKGQLYIRNDNGQGIEMNNAQLTFNGGQYSVKGQDYAIETTGTQPGKVTFNDGYFRMRGGEESFAPSADVRQNGGIFDTAVTETVQNEAPVSNQQSSVFSKLSELFGFGNESANNNNNSTMPSQNNAGMPSGSTMPQNGSAPAMNEMTPEGEMADPFNGQTTITSSTDTAGEIVEGTTTNSAMDLEANYENATYYVMSEDDSQITITTSGTYVISGECSDGNITVKKGTTGVVLVLDDLDLTSTTGAALSVNKNAEVQIIVSGTVNLTDAENPDDEDSEDEAVADAYDGAAVKVKANAVVFITGDGTLNINGTAKNGIKGGDDSSIILGGDELTVNITAANDGINGNYDVTLLSGTYNISAVDDAIHADHILTIGNDDGTGPNVNITESTEGLEGTVVNIKGGNINITSSDDAINAANGDGVYEGKLEYSFNMTGGSVTVNSQGDGIDSNGNINLIDGSAVINSASNGGEAGIDYDGDLYISQDFELNNRSGVAGPDNMGGMMGPMDQQGANQNFGGQPDGNTQPDMGFQKSGMQGDMGRR